MTCSRPATLLIAAALIAGCHTSNKPTPTTPQAAMAAMAPLMTVTQVASFDHQVTGVAVSKAGRIFVNFPRWTEDSPVSVGEVMSDGSVKAYPNDEWNRWRNESKTAVTPQDHFVCVQSVVVDPMDHLWVVDPGAPATANVVPGAAKLVEIDLKTNAVVATIPLGPEVAPPRSYANDIRFSPDGHWAYLTDSGAGGALLVVDLHAGHVRRVLADTSVTQPEKVTVMYDGKPLRRPDGRGVEFASDGLAASPDGAYVYWQALTGKTLYRAKAGDLQNESLSHDDLLKKVERVGETCVADGYWMDKQNRLYVTSPEDNSVKLRQADGSLVPLVRDDKLRWPDSMAEGSDGTLYVTASHIQDSPWYTPGAPTAVKTALFKFGPMR